jgi:hypothetical protein
MVAKMSPRFPLEFPVTINGEIQGQSENLSITGLGLRLVSKDVSLLVGTSVTVCLKITDPDAEARELSIQAQVIWSQDGRCGLNIERMSAEDRTIYDALIEGYATLCSGFARYQAAG